MRALATWSGALAGLMAILFGSLVPAAILVPAPQISVIDLPATWQVSALLTCAMVSGPRAGVIAAIAYLSMGAINLPVFHGGGGLHYLLEPGFGYLAGFIPAAWLTGRLANQDGMNDLAAQSLSAVAGFVVLQLCGLLNLGLGALLGRWNQSMSSLVVQYSLGPLPAQILLCITSSLLAVILRRLLIVKS
ncbi:biotin transporter BioY [Synechococcus sp. M16CYN]|uniref:biotin transporter BioY n=1 Tax=Synechococcus sp. M16CYN TaxID=3103139 RepID=UPI0032552F5F